MITVAILFAVPLSHCTSESMRPNIEPTQELLLKVHDATVGLGGVSVWLGICTTERGVDTEWRYTSHFVTIPLTLSVFLNSLTLSLSFSLSRSLSLSLSVSVFLISLPPSHSLSFSLSIQFNSRALLAWEIYVNIAKASEVDNKQK